MNLVQLRQALVEQSGQRGLVEDAAGGDWSDKTGLVTNATHYINAAIRWLDRRWSQTDTFHRYTVNVISGQYEVPIPRIRNIHRIDIRANGNERQRVSYANLEEFRNCFRLPLEDEATGTPLYWTYSWPELGGGLIDAGFQREPVFLTQSPPYTLLDSVTASASNPGVWHVQNENRWSWSLGTLSWEKPSGQTDISIAAINLGRHFTRGATMTATVSLDAGKFKIGFADSEAPLADPGQTAWLSAGGSIALAATAQWDTIVFFVGSESGGAISAAAEGSITGLTVEIPRSEDRNILIAPPADGSYTMTIWADFDESPMSLDADENFWSMKYPELVVRAARVQLEMDSHRNASGAALFQSQIEGELDRMLAEDNFALISSLTPQEAVRHG